MTVSLLTADVKKFDPSKYVARWMSSSKAQRRPNFKDKVKPPSMKKRRLEVNASEAEMGVGDKLPDAAGETDDGDKLLDAGGASGEQEDSDVEDVEENGVEMYLEKNNVDSESDNDEGFDDHYRSDDEDNEIRHEDVFEMLENELQDMSEDDD